MQIFRNEVSRSDSQSTNIKITAEIAEKYQDRKIPNPDTSIRREEIETEQCLSLQRFRYSKLRNTAMEWNMKRASLAKEANRRMLNADRYSIAEDRVRILNKYDNKLALSQYKREERKEVIESGVRAYERRVKRAEVNG